MKPSDKRFLEKIRTKVSKAIEDYRLIESNDTVVVGVSGGKDSMALLDILHNRRQALKIPYNIVAVHIQLTDVPYHTDALYLRDFCEARRIQFELITDEIKIIKKNKQPCFYCSWNRRKLLFEFTGHNNFQKIALGHHKDDLIETLMMNMIQHGELSAFPVKLSMFDDQFTLIRPLIYIGDKELQRYIDIIGYKPLPYDCSYAKNNQRESYKNLIKQFYRFNPKAIDNIFKAIKNIDFKHLP